MRASTPLAIVWPRSLQKHYLVFNTFSRPKLYIPSIRAAFVHSKKHKMPLLPTPGLTDAYTYTGGRWLLNDKLQREARYIQFDFGVLCKRVVELCPGATSILNFEKKEGGFNRVFIFTTDNGKRLVARLPFRHADPPKFTTSSEVATVRYREFKSIKSDGNVN